MLNRCKEINKFYRSEVWRQTRLLKISNANGRCEKCGGVGEEVHHIIPINEHNINNPEITLNLNNLILLCKDCHNKEHGRFKISDIKFDSNGNLESF